MSNEDSPATGPRVDARMLTHLQGSAILQRAVRGGRLTAGCPSGQRERSVKPSAQPTLVRTQHLPPRPETTLDLRIRRSRLFGACAVARGLGPPYAAGCAQCVPKFWRRRRRRLVLIAGRPRSERQRRESAWAPIRSTTSSRGACQCIPGAEATLLCRLALYFMPEAMTEVISSIRSWPTKCSDDSLTCRVAFGS